MSDTKDAPSTFLIWNPAGTVDKKDQVFRRHRHAAIVHHQRRKRRDGQSESRISSKILPSKPSPKDSAAITTPSSSQHSSSTSSGGASPIIEPASGRIDPFDVLCIQGFPSEALSLVQFAIKDQWPAFTSSSQPQVIEKWRSTTMHLAMEAPYLLQAITYAGCCYQLFFGSGDHSTEFLRLNSHHETIKYVRDALYTSNGVISDAMLMSIAILGVHSSSLPPQQRPRAQDTMSHDNDFYSSQPWDQTHINAVLLFTKRKGGLESIMVEDLRGMINVIDVQDSLGTLRKPTFPLPVSTTTAIQSICAKWSPDRRRKFASRQNGFKCLLEIDGGEDLFNLTTRICSLLESFDLMLQEGPQSGMDFNFLVAIRRYLQHDALSLPLHRDPLHKLCRLAIITYMAESIEPSSAQWPLHATASKALMLALDECDKIGIGERQPELLTWATVVGAFTARDTPLFEWYIEQLCSYPFTKAGGSWDEVQQQSERYLVLKYRHGQLCGKVWETARSRSSEDRSSLPLRHSIIPLTQ
ncbi:uncharacterized protein A1O9_00169 [Exophiala aquamarina CBS 119918]|uniref:Uncharacterized protein n=1 Tax=Exophiala aquamarina CBS 119918 TaxID=1182545 RepID=A0A072PR17_9EURO|nr:uncharacterized protein A1O9_00169 [Exophiala aquamarina CBS 119918]KEF62197.1 hypothetical protein A1O9_00169 [Exophiala aquamarina CBS 119918]